MKISCIMLTLMVTGTAFAQELVSIDEFSKEGPMEREVTIAAAPSAQKAELERIHAHLMLLHQCGSEEGIRFAKEQGIAKARGFDAIVRLPYVYFNLWSHYILGVVKADEKAGMAPEQLAAVEVKLNDEQMAHAKQFISLHDLIYHLAPSPEALALERSAFDIENKYRPPSQPTQSTLPPTKDKLNEATQDLSQLMEQLKHLPTLTPAERQKEYDDFPEAKLL